MSGRTEQYAARALSRDEKSPALPQKLRAQPLPGPKLHFLTSSGKKASFHSSRLWPSPAPKQAVQGKGPAVNKQGSFKGGAVAG
jgi:hypothetical protein